MNLPSLRWSGVLVPGYRPPQDLDRAATQAHRDRRHPAPPTGIGEPGRTGRLRHRRAGRAGPTATL